MGIERCPVRVASGLLLTLLCCAAHAGIVVLNIDMPLDQVAAGQPAKLGEHHSVRVFYDDATIDRATQVVRVLQMQHLDKDQWKPQTLDPDAMPIIDAWLDLKSKPYRYHYRAALMNQGTPVFVQFDEQSRRFSIVLQKDLSVLIAAPYSIDTVAVTGVNTADALRSPPAFIGLNLYVTLDQVAAGEGSQIGDVDRLRVVYDANAIDPVTRRVRILNLQHYTGGVFQPAHPDALVMPTNDAWLDLSSAPYRLHYSAKVTHGKPLLIEMDENARRLTIRAQQPPGGVLISGIYGFDPAPVTGPDIAAAAMIGGDAAGVR